MECFARNQACLVSLTVPWYGLGSCLINYILGKARQYYQDFILGRRVKNPAMENETNVQINISFSIQEP